MEFEIQRLLRRGTDGETMKILVTGATGFLGKYVIDELLAHDYSIVAFGRNEKIGNALEGERVQFIKGDLSSIEEFKTSLSVY